MIYFVSLETRNKVKKKEQEVEHRPSLLLPMFLTPQIQFFTFLWPCNVTNFFLIKPTHALISQIYSVKKLYMFRAVSLPIIRSLPLYIRHWYMSSNLHDIYQCRMYNGRLLMLGRETAQNM